jgi:DNA polymerase-4
VVYDMSDEAYKQGIRKGMPLARAQRLNKKIKILPPSFNRYELVMRDLLRQSLAFTPLIEYGSTDGHIFMDVTGSRRLFGPGADVAFKLRKEFKRVFNFDPIWSVATNKLIAKVATRVVKPVGEYIVPPGHEESFLAPLPIHLIPGLGKKDLRKLQEFNLFAVSQARALSVKQLEIPFDQRASMIYDKIRGLDTAPVTAFCENNFQIEADHDFCNDTNDAALLRKALYLMIEKICQNLRTRKLAGVAVLIILSYSDGLQTCSKLKLRPTSNDMIMFKKCIRLLDKAWTRRVRIRHMRFVCEKFCRHEIQNQLFTVETKSTKQSDIIFAMEKIRGKFGENTIKPALTMINEN